MAVLDRAPSVADLRRTAAVFRGFANADVAWLWLTEATKPAIDLARDDHRALLLRCLNAWGCRIRYPREGEPAPFDAGVAQWWRSWRAALPPVSLAHLADSEIDAVAEAFTALAVVEVSAVPGRRVLGSTAAAKTLYALRPRTLLPWDAAIATRMHGGRGGAAYARHLRLGRAWASLVIAESGGDEESLPERVGRPGVSLAKIIDEYLYVTITMSSAAARNWKE